MLSVFEAFEAVLAPCQQGIEEEDEFPYKMRPL
jgi:hypothetical protein